MLLSAVLTAHGVHMEYTWNLLYTQQSSDELQIQFRCSCSVMGWLTGITRTLTANIFWAFFLLGGGIGHFWDEGGGVGGHFVRCVSKCTYTSVKWNYFNH